MVAKILKFSLLAIFATLLFVAVKYANFYVLERTVTNVSRELNLELNSILSHSILNKYSGLLNEVPTHVGTNPYHINLAIKLRAEFIHALNGLKNVDVVLYSPTGVVMFTVSENFDSTANVHPLTEEQLSFLSEGKVLHEKIGNRVYSSLFPVYSDNSDSNTAFLKITKDYSELAETLSARNIVASAPVGLVVIICVILIAIVHRKNRQLLTKQCDVNLELREKKENAERDSVGKSQFLANVSHELRTPLNSIIGFSEIIVKESFGPIGNEQYKEYVHNIHSAGTHLLSLINDIFDFSRAEANKLVVELVRCDLRKVVDACFKMLSTKAQEAKIDLQLDVPETQIVVLADAGRMRQVILNILTNALKFTPENGFVKLTVSVKDNVTIEVSDNGIGIAEQDLYKVMSVFGQADSAHSRRYEGAGLGLPLSKKLVELMNGTFSIKSEPSLGTVVTMVFPHVEEDNSGEKSF
ncbi:sensor histidine kinase [Anaplasma bovis]|uniref:sensor histidine kinase n=1 Tax=Anaplasma bovis TaxID=186733 RepID=UPI002FF2A99D